MSQPLLPDPGRDEDPPGGDGLPGAESAQWRPVSSSPDWPEDKDYLAALAGDDEPGDVDLWEDPESAPPPGLDDAGLAELMAGAREIPADRIGLAELAARTADSRALDDARGCAALALFADDVAGGDDRYAGAADDDVVGAACAWNRIEAHASARKHAAVAELIRRRPEPGSVPAGAADMPGCWDEFTAAELAPALAESRTAAEDVLDLAYDLAVKLPGTWAAFRAGLISRYKAAIIAAAVQLLDGSEAQAAERLVLGRAGRLTPGGLRPAIARAVMQVAPGKARKRREHAAKRARVERWAEDSGNAALAGRELPSAEVLAADQRVTWWAEQLRKAGLEGGMDALRARAYMDILLGIDSRPAGSKPASPSRPDQLPVPGQPPAPDEPQAPDQSPAPDESPVPAGTGPLAGVVPPGFAGHVNLTVPLATVLGLADRPGEMAGIGPIDPALARDLAAAAARNTRSTWCVTVTDADGHAIGHGCARPEPASSRRGRAQRAGRASPGGHVPDGHVPDGHDPPAAPRAPGFTFTPASRDGPPGGYGSWQLATGTPGQPGLIVQIEPLPTEKCDHRYQARGHDPGVMLRHLAQVRHATCTGPGCRRPASRCDFEHNIPYEAGGRTCVCNGNPKCRRDHRVKQDPRWQVEQLADGGVRWTTPSGRQYTTEPTRYPI